MNKQINLHTCFSRRSLVSLVVAAIVLMLLAGKTDHPFDGIIYWLSKIAAVFAAICFTPVAFKIVASRLDARRLARDQHK